MYWAIPAEMISSAVQLMICFFTMAAFLLSFMMTARA